MRSRRDIPLSHTVSYGPIRRLRNDKEKMEFSMFGIFVAHMFETLNNRLLLSVDAGGIPSVETFVLGGLLVVLLLITGVFGRLWLRSRHFYPAQEAQLTLSNIHHISEVAS